jgi:hypothetical protein
MGPQLRKTPNFMKPEGTLPVSRAPPPTDPYAVPDESS